MTSTYLPVQPRVFQVRAHIMKFWLFLSMSEPQPPAQTEVIPSALVPFLQPHSLDVWLS